MTGLLLTRSRTGGPFTEEHHRLIASARAELGGVLRRHLRITEETRAHRRIVDALSRLLPGPCVLVGHDGLRWTSSALAAQVPAAALGEVLEGLEEAGRALLATPSGPGAPISFCDGALVFEWDVDPYDPTDPVAIGRLTSTRSQADPAPYGDLTRAENAVLERIAQGLSNRAIAASLHVSVDTVKTHVSRILGKLGVRSRTQAALVVARARGGPATG